MTVGLCYFSILLSKKTDPSLSQSEHFHSVKSVPSSNDGIFNFDVKDIEGEIVNLGKAFKSKFKLMLVVNVASKWGKTKKNYSQLQVLYERYHSLGLEILAFPCNQFKNQEPGTNSEINQFVHNNFHITFPIMSKVDVNGEGADPLFAYLRKAAMHGDEIRWNFNKFLVDQNGLPIVSFDPRVDPLDLEGDIKRILGA
jgi:glutathione peroxidase